MKSETTVEQFFHVLDQSATLLQNQLSVTYLEAVVQTGENLFQKDVLQQLDPVAKESLRTLYQSIQLERLSKETVRRGMQLAILKGMREATQPHHEMTPDAVCLLLAHFVEKLAGERSAFTLLDPVCGTGNLLTAVLNHCTKKRKVAGVEVDDLLIRLAYVNANLQGHEVELIHQDSLRPLFVDPVDFICADLPVGIYPDEKTALNFVLAEQGGRSYSHHLLIEQSLHYTKPGGYLLFLIPNGLFETEQAEKLKAFLKKEAVIVGLLQLPDSLFKNKAHAKRVKSI